MYFLTDFLFLNELLSYLTENKFHKITILCFKITTELGNKREIKEKNISEKIEKHKPKSIVRNLLAESVFSVYITFYAFNILRFIPFL